MKFAGNDMLHFSKLPTQSGIWQYRIGRSTIVIYAPWGTRMVRPVKDFLSQGDNIERSVEKWIKSCSAATVAVA